MDEKTKKEQPKAIRVTKQVLSIAGITLLSLICILLVTNIFQRLILKQKYPTIFGYGRAIIGSNSMYPDLKKGDLIITKKRATYEVGDTITFYDGKSTTTHQIIADNGETFTTKGKNNEDADLTPLSKDRICGEQILVLPITGLIIGYIKTPLGIISLILLAGAIIILSYATKKSKT